MHDANAKNIEVPVGSEITPIVHCAYLMKYFKKPSSIKDQILHYMKTGNKLDCGDIIKLSENERTIQNVLDRKKNQIPVGSIVVNTVLKNLKIPRKLASGLIYNYTFI
jgi:hypothetical protein